MENYKSQNLANTNQNNQELNNAEPMEKDDIINPDQFKVGRANDSDQDDSEYSPEENEFADGKGTQLAEEFDAPDEE